MDYIIRNRAMELLQTENLKDLDSTKKQINKISTEIFNIREKIKNHFENQSKNLLINLNNIDILCNEGKSIKQEVKFLLKEADDETLYELQLSNDELDNFMEEISEIKLGLTTTHKLLKINELFDHLEEAKTEQNILQQMEIIGQLKSLIFGANDNILPHLMCFQNLKTKYNNDSGFVLQNLKKLFEDLFRLEKNMITNSYTIKISKEQIKLKNVIIGLYNAKYNPSKIYIYFFNLFEVVIKESVSIRVFEENCNFYELIVNVISLEKESIQNKRNYTTVFDNILKILNHLNHINFDLSDSECVFERFGKNMIEKFYKLLISECLVKFIPDENDENMLSIFISDIEEFRANLVKLRLLSDISNNDLNEFLSNLRKLSINQFYKKSMEQAIIIMKKDLYNTIETTSISSELKSQNYSFPICAISKSILELIDILNNIIKESDEESIAVVLKIAYHYISEVPKYHEKMLNNIPQQVALYFNNTTVFGIWLLSNLDNDNLETQKLLKLLNETATTHFNKQVEAQHKTLNMILRDFDLSDAVAEIQNDHHKIVLQCLRQLDLLKNVWQSVLPDDLYSLTMLNLINEFFEELIRKIILSEDIPSVISNELVEIICTIEERISRLFEKNKLVKIPSWNKLLQLRLILKATLVEITDYWADGVGQLSYNFQAEEVRHLIRALFQNTERRANALALIS